MMSARDYEWQLSSLVSLAASKKALVATMRQWEQIGRLRNRLMIIAQRPANTEQTAQRAAVPALSVQANNAFVVDRTTVAWGCRVWGVAEVEVGLVGKQVPAVSVSSASDVLSSGLGLVANSDFATRKAREQLPSQGSDVMMDDNVESRSLLVTSEVKVRNNQGKVRCRRVVGVEEGFWMIAAEP